MGIEEYLDPPDHINPEDLNKWVDWAKSNDFDSHGKLGD